MSRRNRIKKDIWGIMRDVYRIADFNPITDKQNEFLDKVIKYFEHNYTLRKKSDGKVVEVDENEPIDRPEPAPKPDFAKTSLRRGRRVKSKIEDVKETKTDEIEPEAEPEKPKEPKSKVSIDINALPEHLRKYALKLQ